MLTALMEKLLDTLKRDNDRRKKLPPSVKNDAENLRNTLRWLLLSVFVFLTLTADWVVVN